MKWDSVLTAQKFFRASLAKPSTKWVLIIFAVSLAIVSVAVGRSKFLPLLIAMYTLVGAFFFLGLYLVCALRVRNMKKYAGSSTLSYNLSADELKVSLPGKDAATMARSQLKVANQTPDTLILLYNNGKQRREVILLFDDRSELTQCKNELTKQS